MERKIYTEVYSKNGVGSIQNNLAPQGFIPFASFVKCQLKRESLPFSFSELKHCGGSSIWRPRMFYVTNNIIITYKLLHVVGTNKIIILLFIDKAKKQNN